MDELSECYAKQNRSQKTNTVPFHLNKVPKIVKLIETERVMVARGWQQRLSGELFNGHRVSVLKDEQSSGDWLHNENVLNTTELYTLKVIYMVNLLCMFYPIQNQKKKKTPPKPVHLGGKNLLLKSSLSLQCSAVSPQCIQVWNSCSRISAS